MQAMLAVTADLTRLRFPLTAQVKYDGVRCLIDPVAGAITREGVPIPNPTVQSALAGPELWGMDGELVAPGGFEVAQSAFMGTAPPPDGWFFIAFDLADAAGGFPERFHRLSARIRALYLADGPPPPVSLASTRRLNDRAELDAWYGAALDQGEEGIVLRADGWQYRPGKASTHRGELLKLKPTDEAEARILAVTEHAGRPGQLGSVYLDWKGSSFGAVPALPATEAARLWTRRANLPGKLATVRHNGFTASGLPRHARLIGLRRDISPTV